MLVFQQLALGQKNLTKLHIYTGKFSLSKSTFPEKLCLCKLRFGGGCLGGKFLLFSCLQFIESTLVVQQKCDIREIFIGSRRPSVKEVVNQGDLKTFLTQPFMADSIFLRLKLFLPILIFSFKQDLYKQLLYIYSTLRQYTLNDCSRGKQNRCFPREQSLSALLYSINKINHKY